MQSFIKKLLVSLDNKKIGSFEIKDNTSRVKVVKLRKKDEAANVYIESVKQSVDKGESSLDSQKSVDDKEKVIHSSYVGFFYRNPKDDEAPFVTEGDKVVVGQTLGLVRSMNIMHEIKSDVEGVLNEVLVEAGRAIEYEQPLFKIRVEN